MNNIKLQSIFFNFNSRQMKHKWYVHNKNTFDHMKMQKRSTMDVNRCYLNRILNLLRLQEQEGSESIACQKRVMQHSNKGLGRACCDDTNFIKKRQNRIIGTNFVLEIIIHS